MATPLLVTDGTTEFNQAQLNRALMSDGTALSVKTHHARVRHTGAVTEVVSSTDSAGLVTANIVFDAGDTEFDITISGFTNPPSVQLTPHGTSAYTVKMVANSNVLINVGFYNIDTGVKIATGVGDTDMDFHIFIIGT